MLQAPESSGVQTFPQALLQKDGTSPWAIVTWREAHMSVGAWLPQEPQRSPPSCCRLRAFLKESVVLGMRLVRARDSVVNVLATGPVLSSLRRGCVGGRQEERSWGTCRTWRSARAFFRHSFPSLTSAL